MSAIHELAAIVGVPVDNPVAVIEAALMCTKTLLEVQEKQEDLKAIRRLLPAATAECMRGSK
jgi:hypothetical protein